MLFVPIKNHKHLFPLQLCPPVKLTRSVVQNIDDEFFPTIEKWLVLNNLNPNLLYSAFLVKQRAKEKGVKKPRNLEIYLLDPIRTEKIIFKLIEND